MMRRFLITIALLVVAGEVRAQDSLRARRDSAQRLPTLDVTTGATRSTRPPLEQPLAISRIRAAEWQDRRGTGLEEALTFVPGVLAQSRAGWSDIRLVIRGHGARGAGDRSNAGTSRGVRVLLDGFPETEPDGRTAFDLIDLSAASGIEVVRSNASAVWGNAAGGVVSVSTLRPTTATYGEFDPAIGSFGSRRVTVAAGYHPGEGQIGGSLVHARSDGWRAHSDGERLLANLAMTFPAGAEGRIGVFLTGGFNRYNIPGPLTRDQAARSPRQANPTYQARRERRHNRLGRIGVTYETHFGDRHEIRASVFAGPKFLQRSERGTFRDFTRYHVGGSAIYRLSTSLGAGVQSQLSVGVDEAYQDGAVLFYSLSPTADRGGTLTSDKREGAENTGIFVQEELRFGSRWSVLVGARYDDITYYAEDHLEDGRSGRKSFGRVSPKVGVTFRSAPTRSFYFSVGGGVEAPAGNETDPASTFGQDQVYAINPLLEPIVSTSYELGLKQVAVFGSGTTPWELTWDAAGYYTSVRNEIVPYRGGRFYFTAGSAGRAGIETGGRLRRGGLTLQGMLSWSHHTYRRYTVDSVHYGQPGRIADYSGNRVVGVPDWSHAVGVGLAPAAWGGLGAQLTVQGTGGYWADDANQIRVDGSTIAGLSLSAGRPIALPGGLGLRGAIAVQNVMNRRTIASAFLNPDIVDGEAIAFEPGLPRTYVLSLSLGWLDGR